MFDIGWAELLIVMVVALVVIGPKELPNAIRTFSTVMRTVRRAARDFQNSLEELARESGVDEIKREFDGIDRYDPGEALKRMAENDGETDEREPAAGNSILDRPAKAPPGETIPDPDDPSGPTTAAAPRPGPPRAEDDDEDGDGKPRPAGQGTTAGGRA